MKRFLLEPPPVAAAYSPVLLTPPAIARIASSPRVINRTVELARMLDPDEFTSYVARLCDAGLALAGADWGYMDLLTVLYAVAEMGQPENYLEVGVRRGRSAVMVASAAPHVRIYGFDMWMESYAGADNPGPEFVAVQLKKAGHLGAVEFVSGNSHETLPRFFASNPDLKFDLINIDGDHSRKGARQDLEDVIPRLAVGGVLVFDDVGNPYTPDLAHVWEDTLHSHPELSGFEYRGAGTGVAFAIKTHACGHNLGKRKRRLLRRVIG